MGARPSLLRRDGPVTREEIVWLDSSQLEGGSWMRKDVAVGMMDDLRQRTVGFVVAAVDERFPVMRRELA